MKAMMNSLRHVCVAVAVAAAAMVVVAGTAQSAYAQPGGGGGRGGFGGGMGGMGAPAVNGRQLEKYGTMLGLTEDQQASAKALLDGYEEQVRQSGEAVRDKMQEARDKFQETRDPSAWEGVQGMMQEARATRKKADESFMSDVKSLLTPEQAEKWPTVERAQRRDTGLRTGFLSGERVNLYELVDEAKLEGEAATEVQTALTEYDVELDRAIVARNTAYEEAFGKFAELRESGDMKAAQEYMDKGREAAVRLREVNRKFARQITDMLPEERKAAFEAAFRRASFPDVYRPTAAARSLEAAEGFADLTETQRESIKNLRESYTRSLGSLNEKLAAETEKTEMSATIEGMMMRRGGGGGRVEGDAGDFRRERRELTETAEDSLKKILTPEQAAKLPRLGEGRGGRGDEDAPAEAAPRRRVRQGAT